MNESERWKLHKEADLLRIEHSHAIFIHAMESMRSYAQNALRGVFLINGGACIALLTLIGSLYGKDNRNTLLPQVIISSSTDSLLYFSLGLFFSVLSSFVAYLNYGILAQGEYTHAEAHQWLVEGKDPERNTKKLQLRLVTTYYVAIGVGIVALIHFIIGCWSFYHTVKLIAQG